MIRVKMDVAVRLSFMEEKFIMIGNQQTGRKLSYGEMRMRYG